MAGLLSQNLIYSSQINIQGRESNFDDLVWKETQP